jgi:hypothetical protein
MAVVPAQPQRAGLAGRTTPFGRPILYRGDRRCPHSGRVLGTFVFANGRRHVVDWCLLCGGRTDAIARADLEAADIDWRRIPVMLDNEGAGA